MLDGREEKGREEIANDLAEMQHHEEVPEESEIYSNYLINHFVLMENSNNVVMFHGDFVLWSNEELMFAFRRRVLKNQPFSIADRTLFSIFYG